MALHRWSGGSHSHVEMCGWLTTVMVACWCVMSPWVGTNVTAQIKDNHTKADACLNIIPRPDTLDCMMSNDDFSVDAFSGDNAKNRRASDFILHIDYETFRIYSMLSKFYGQYGCFGKSEDCIRCQVQSSPEGDYRIAENQFQRWERLMAPYMGSFDGLYKFMFVRPNALTPAYSIRGVVNTTSMGVLCNADANASYCCGARIGLDAVPRQHDNISCTGLQC